MYSLDFRKRVLEMKNKAGLTEEETCKRFGICRKTLHNWKQRINPHLKRNKPATKIDMEALRADVKKYPHKYQYERAQMFGVSAWAIGVALRRLKISYKKNAVSSKSGRAGTYTLSNKNG